MSEQDWHKTVGEQIRDKGCAGGRTPEQRAKDMIELLVAALPQSDAVFTAQRQGTQHTAREVAVGKVLRAAFFDGCQGDSRPDSRPGSQGDSTGCQGDSQPDSCGCQGDSPAVGVHSEKKFAWPRAQSTDPKLTPKLCMWPTATLPSAPTPSLGRRYMRTAPRPLNGPL